jgi:hypothetical protein
MSNTVEAGPSVGTVVIDERAAVVVKKPGWYALRSNPNEQSYWNGENFSGLRHWVAGQGWVEGALGSASTKSDPAAILAKYSTNPYLDLDDFNQLSTSSLSLDVGKYLLLVSGVGLIWGSIGPWIGVAKSSGLAGGHTSINGTASALSTLTGANGWITLAAGCALLALVVLSIFSGKNAFTISTALVSMAIAATASYQAYEVVQKVSGNPGVTVKWGLICVLGAAALAFLVSIGRVISSR